MLIGYPRYRKHRCETFELLNPDIAAVNADSGVELPYSSQEREAFT